MTRRRSSGYVPRKPAPVGNRRARGGRRFALPSPRVICISFAAILVAMVAGMGLGHFATGHLSTGLGAGEDSWAAAAPQDRKGKAEAAAQPSISPNGPSDPVNIECQGCGPGIAERQDFAFGYDDPAIDNYLQQDVAYRPDIDGTTRSERTGRSKSLVAPPDPTAFVDQQDAGPLSRPLEREPAGRRSTARFPDGPVVVPTISRISDGGTTD